MASSWFYVHNQQQVGPISEEEIIRLFQRGVLGPATLVGQAGGGWQPASLSPLAYLVYEVQAEAPIAAYIPAAAPPPEPEWYYANGQQQLGPLPEVNIRHLIQHGQIGPDTYVGQAGGSWLAVKDSTLASSLPVAQVQAPVDTAQTIDSSFIYKSQSPRSFSERQTAAFGAYAPPPTPNGQAATAILTEERKNINDSYAWLIALLPLLGFLGRIGQMYFKPDVLVSDLMLLRGGGAMLIATVFLVFLDKGLISRAGTKSPSFFLFLIPVAYLFRRAQYLSKTMLPAVVWLIGVAGFAGCSWIVQTLKGYGLPLP